jgi:hypothetical protein
MKVLHSNVLILVHTITLGCILTFAVQPALADENKLTGYKVQWIVLPVNLNQFPILSPEPGSEEIECGERPNGLAVGQWNNDKAQSVCIKPDNSDLPVECDGASWGRASVAQPFVTGKR